MSNVRVRMAPSPTGPIHVGNLHTALFNWLFARNQGGTFVLRFEDTDRERSRSEWEEVIYQEMKWLGLDWDEGPDKPGPHGPYRQMERLDLYACYAQKLVESGHAYPCYCTPEELEAERQEAQRKGVAYLYSRKCRHLTADERARLEAEGRKPVLRFAVPDGVTVSFDDIVRGRIDTPSDSISDFVLVRSNGIPVYNFAVVVDDITMKITHIIRGEGHISNTPVQVLIYQALGEPVPQIGHIGHILGTDRAKLSKRNGDAYVGDYRDRGFLPEALLNFMALLGWTPEGGREFLTKEEMIREFDIRRVTKAAAVFDLQKLEWMNGNYVRQKSVSELTDLCLPFLQRAGLVTDPLPAAERPRVEAIVALEQERIKTLAEITQATDFFFKEEIEYNANDVAKMLTAETRPHLAAVAQRLRNLAEWTVPAIEQAVRGYVEEHGLKVKAVFQPVRVAVTGRTVSPPLFESMALLGRERCLQRLEQAATEGAALKLGAN